MTAPVTNAHLEARLEGFFRRRVRLLGGHAIKFIPVERGIPDRLVLMPGGRIFLVELKQSTGTLSEHQKLWHRRCSQVGTEVITLYGKSGILTWLRTISDHDSEG